MHMYTRGGNLQRIGHVCILAKQSQLNERMVPRMEPADITFHRHPNSLKVHHSQTLRRDKRMPIVKSLNE